MQLRNIELTKGLRINVCLGVVVGFLYIFLNSFDVLILKVIF
jgi:hypothetical protein